MFEAQLLVVKGAGTSVLSPWFSRGGDYLIATAEFTAGTGQLTVEVLTKNIEDSGDGTAILGVSIDLTAGTGRGDAEFTGLEELVRYRFTAAGSVNQWVFLRMLPPIWFDAVI